MRLSRELRTEEPRHVARIRPVSERQRGEAAWQRALAIKRSLWSIFCLLLTLVTCACEGAGLKVVGLKCEYRTDPLGIGTAAPRLSWVLESRDRDQSQIAYQVLAASSLGRLSKKADLWDSGKVASADSIHVVYSGQPLHSGQRVFWKVRVWDTAGKESTYSRPAWFETALLSQKDWDAVWIERPSAGPVAEDQAFDDHPAPLLRKEFTLDKKIARARVYVSGLGYYELRLNGGKVGNHVLDPGWTTCSKRVLYSTYDVTRLLKRGRNAVGIMLGNGWFNPLPLRMWNKLNLRDALTVGEPRALAQIVVEFADGTTRVIGTDESWKAGDGPILRNSVYLGEVYDARREQVGWDKAGFDDSNWKSAVVATEPKLGPLQAQSQPPIRVTRILKPVKLTEPKPGVFIFDFGQNFAGWARLRVRGPAGTRVRLRSGELLYPDGTLNGMTAVCGQIKGGGKNYRYNGVGAPKTAFQIDEYILKGQGTEVFTPHFTFHGFRYVEVTGFPGKPTLNSLEGLRLNADVQPDGAFECSNTRFNRIQQMVLRTELSNLFSVQSDCPGREKFGYGGDIAVSSEMAMLNFNMEQFYAKVVRDLGDAVRANGGFTETAPFVGISDHGLGEQSGPVGFGLAQPLLLWQLRQYYGDERLLEEQYEATKRWIALLRSKAVDGILDNSLGDHECLDPTPLALSGTAFYYFNVKLFARIARAVGRKADAAEADALADKIKAAFNTKFLKPGTGQYDGGTQGCQAFALYLELVPDGEKSRALHVLVRNIQKKNAGHLSTGIYGTKYMLDSLTDLGRADVAYEVVNQRTFPGWGWMLENGATTLWEHWRFSDNVYSHNHPMFGSVSEWFYKALAGIRPAPDADGFNKIILEPEPVGDLSWVKARYDSVRGRIVSEWRKENGEFNWHVRVPVGARATVFVPAHECSQISESGRPVDSAPGVKFLRIEDGKAVLTVGSGDYHFVSKID